MITADLVADETERDTKGWLMTPEARREELLREVHAKRVDAGRVCAACGGSYP
jgi:hypothetical protein